MTIGNLDLFLLIVLKRIKSKKNILIYCMNPVLSQLQRITHLQCKDDLYFTDGLFAAERLWAKGFYRRKDNTAFFAACIGFTLKRYTQLFKEEELVLVKGILANMKPAFASFRNKDGHASYNFWQTNPSRHFPGGHFAGRFQFFMIPDDIDDSAMIHLVIPHSAHEQLSLKEKMVKYAIGNLKWPDKPVNGYERYKPYNTFFVKNMPAAFDICALCNALYFVYFYQLPLNEQDEHSMSLIKRCIENDDHLMRPYEMSPYYPQTPLILYHLVRFIIDMKVEPLKPLVEKLLKQCEQLLQKAPKHGMTALILQLSIQKIKGISIALMEPDEKEKACFPFFVAGILGEVGPKWLRSLASANATHIKYCCNAYAEVLWLEHLLLNRAAQQVISDN